MQNDMEDFLYNYFILFFIFLVNLIKIFQTLIFHLTCNQYESNVFYICNVELVYYYTYIEYSKEKK